MNKIASTSQPKPGPSVATPKPFQQKLTHLALQVQRHVTNLHVELQKLTMMQAQRHQFHQSERHSDIAVWKTATAAIITSVCLHLGHADTAYASNFASVTEDKLLETMRGVEAKFGGALDQLREGITSPRDGGANTEAAQQAARNLVLEVYEVVDANFSDVRSAGYRPEAWKALLDKILARPLRDQSAAYSAVREMLAELHDPYSRFLTPPEFSAMAKYDVSGVGLNLTTAEEFQIKTATVLPEDRLDTSKSPSGVWVVGLIQGSIADRAGIRQGDELIAADGVSLAGQSPFQVASLLQQQQEAVDSGSTNNSSNMITMTVRALDGSTREVKLQRPQATSKLLTSSPVTYRLQQEDNGGRQKSLVGYIKLTSFDAKAQRDISAAIQDLTSQGANRLVLDLRGNRGGLVTEGVEVAKLFLNNGDIVVKTEGKSRSSTPISATGGPLTQAPLAVLVDGSTASASEIAAGALKDNCRAVLVGNKTYGKGLIQSVYELSDGAGLVLTVGKYVTPAGIDIDREGLAPDFKNIPSWDVADASIAACRLNKK